jgi:hypothetical protein
MNENMEIKVGGFYKTRGGEKVLVRHIDGLQVYSVRGTINPDSIDRRHGCWMRDGSATAFMGEHHEDLVAPWEPSEKPDNGWVPDESTPPPPHRQAEAFRPGDWVKVVWGDIALENRGVSLGDVVQVADVRRGFVHLTEGRGAWDPARFEPALAPWWKARQAVPQVQPTTPEKAPDVSLKDTNPKDSIGSDKLPLHLWPTTATAAGSIALLNGALKYGRANWRHAGVRATIYADAIRRHLDAWLEGEEVDPDDGVPHLWAILAGTAILIDAKAAAKLTDDRNTAGGYREFVSESTAHVKRLKELHKGRNPKHYTVADLPQFP